LIVETAKEIIMTFICQLFSEGVTPIFVWDGEKLKSKAKCVEKRKEAKNKVLEKIIAAREHLESIHPLSRTKEDVANYKKQLVQHNTVEKYEMEHFKELFSLLGIPSITAVNEGEKLCSSLAREGLAAAVWSTDTDNYALGTPLLITGFGGYTAEGRILVNMVDLRIILKDFNKPHEWFVDFCIMCGCDFNENIPGKGPKRCYDLLMKHENIETVQENETKLDVEILNHIECRELFSKEDSGYDKKSTEIIFNITKFRELIRDVVDMYGLHNFYDKLVEHSANVAVSKSVKAKPLFE
jgi:flap endonuclease-1